MFIGVFSFTPCVLYVPAGSVSAYKSADQWKDFTNILPIGAQPADETTTTGDAQGFEDVQGNNVQCTKKHTGGSMNESPVCYDCKLYFTAKALQIIELRK